eukprot:scaffold24052_cov101-Isochrysis_galbana.AAC.1
MSTHSGGGAGPVEFSFPAAAFFCPPRSPAVTPRPGAGAAEPEIFGADTWAGVPVPLVKRSPSAEGLARAAIRSCSQKRRPGGRCQRSPKCCQSRVRVSATTASDELQSICELPPPPGRTCCAKSGSKRARAAKSGGLAL